MKKMMKKMKRMRMLVKVMVTIIVIMKKKRRKIDHQLSLKYVQLLLLLQGLVEQPGTEKFWEMLINVKL